MRHASLSLWSAGVQAAGEGGCQGQTAGLLPAGLQVVPTGPLSRGLAYPAPLIVFRMWKAQLCGVGVGRDNVYRMPSSFPRVPHQACREGEKVTGRPP